MFKTRLIYLIQSRNYSSSLYSPEIIFSKENIKKTVEKFQSLKSLRMIKHEAPRRAAIIIPLCVVEGQVALLYTLRAANLKTHRGQVSFPGGMEDKSDQTLKETALRETYEELGIEENNIDIWGPGPELVSKFETSITPFIGQIKGPFTNSQLKVNRNEVEDVFSVKLEDLCKVENLRYTQFKTAFMSLPVFLGGKHRVWGLTGLITYRFLNCLLPRKAYSHNLKFIPSIINASKS